MSRKTYSPRATTTRQKEGPARLEHAAGEIGGEAPALLVSFYYLDSFEAHRSRIRFRDWVMDSGAFSAYSSGATIDLVEYIEVCQELLATDPLLKEVYALDVIGDWRGTLKNTEAMWAAGVPAIPCFHANEPWDALMHMASTYPKVALGGVALANYRRKLAWGKECFARIWPKKVHGFAFTASSSMETLPFHSVDSTNWAWASICGKWKSFSRGRKGSGLSMKMGLKPHDLRYRMAAEVEAFLRIEREFRSWWAARGANVTEFFAGEPTPTLRLAWGASSGCIETLEVWSGLKEEKR